MNMIIKNMFLQHKLVLCMVFLLLLTIILYGLAKAVIKMCYTPANLEKTEELEDSVKKLDWTMYTPQIILLTLAFVLGIYMPMYINNLIARTIA